MQTRRCVRRSPLRSLFSSQVPWRNRSTFCTARVQHRCGEQIHRKAYPDSRSGLLLGPATGRDPVVRHEQARCGNRRTASRVGLTGVLRLGIEIGIRPGTFHGTELLPTDLLADGLGGRRDELATIRGARWTDRRRNEDRPDAVPHKPAR